MVQYSIAYSIAKYGTVLWFLRHLQFGDVVPNFVCKYVLSWYVDHWRFSCLGFRVFYWLGLAFGGLGV